MALKPSRIVRACPVRSVISEVCIRRLPVSTHLNSRYQQKISPQALPRPTRLLHSVVSYRIILCINVDALSSNNHHNRSTEPASASTTAYQKPLSHLSHLQGSFFVHPHPIDVGHRNRAPTIMYEGEETFSVSSSPLKEHNQQGSSSRPRRSSRFGRRFFRNRKSNRKVENADNPAENREHSPAFNTTASSRDSVSTGRSKKIYGANSSIKLDVPVVSPHNRKVLSKPPPASEAAFGGPPRYDWIDIVSAKDGLLSLLERNNNRLFFTIMVILPRSCVPWFQGRAWVFRAATPADQRILRHMYSCLYIYFCLCT
jgi:hypothetical protein